MARQRKVYPTNEIPHLWAHQTQDEARNPQGNLYFTGPTIYSYGGHFPIASFVEHGGRRAVLFTTRDYSSTTAGHVSATRGAIPSGIPVFKTADPKPWKFDPTHLQSEYSRRMELAEKAVREKTLKMQERMESWRELANTFDRIGEFFSLKPRASKPEDWAELESLAAIKQVKRENVRRAAQAAANTRRANSRARWEQAAQNNREPLEIRQDKWRLGEYVSVSDSPTTLLRVTGDDIETSRGARFPKSHALKALPLIRAVRSRGETWQANGHTCHLGHYQIDRIEPDGKVLAGCHVVEWGEIERIAAQIESAS